MKIMTVLLVKDGMKNGFMMLKIRSKLSTNNFSDQITHYFLKLTSQPRCSNNNV